MSTWLKLRHISVALRLNALILFVFSVLPISALGATNCWGDLSGAAGVEHSSKVNLNRVDRPIFYQPKPGEFTSYDRLRYLIDHASPATMRRARKYLKSKSKFAIEPVPLVMNPDVWAAVEQAAIQRTTAGAELLKDTYSKRVNDGGISVDTKFVRAHPEFAEILESSPLFAYEIAGSEAAKANPFNFTLALDMVIIENDDGTYKFAILESDSGSIGGNLRMPIIAQGLEEVWGSNGLSRDFLDTREAFIERIKRHVQNAREANPLIPEGRALLYTEEESTYGPGLDNDLQKWAAENGLLVASTWNRNDIVFDFERRVYTFQGHPITDFWLEYYTEPLDPMSPVYDRLPPKMKDSFFEMSHALPGFWGHWQEDGFRNWVQHNPQGIEIFTDKAISGALPLAERLFLGKKALIQGNSYENVWRGSDEETQKYIREKAANPMLAVFKSRSDSGQGHGVYLGANMMKGETKNGMNWEQVIDFIASNPTDWVYQPRFKQAPIQLEDGRKRMYEVRVITNYENGKARVLPGLYVRSSAPGSLGNLSGSEGRSSEDLDAPSVIPVLIPRR